MPWPQSDKHACGHLKGEKPYCLTCQRERNRLRREQLKITPTMEPNIYIALARKVWRA